MTKGNKKIPNEEVPRGRFFYRLSAVARKRKMGSRKEAKSIASGNKARGK
jgi:hypothetical protein